MVHQRWLLIVLRFLERLSFLMQWKMTALLFSERLLAKPMTQPITTSILTREYIKPSLLSVTAGANPVYVKKGIDKTVIGLVEELKKRARSVKGSDDIKDSNLW